MHRQTWDIVLLGRLVGVAIIFVGMALSAWTVIDLRAEVGDATFGVAFPTSNYVREFLDGALDWAYIGLLVVAAAEIVDWIRPRRGRRTGYQAAAGPDVITFCRVAGAFMIMAGPALSAWGIIDENRLSGWDSTLTFAQAQEFLEDMLQWLFRGLMIIITAGIADRLRRRGGWRLRSKGVAS